MCHIIDGRYTTLGEFCDYQYTINQSDNLILSRQDADTTGCSLHTQISSLNLNKWDSGLINDKKEQFKFKCLSNSNACIFTNKTTNTGTYVCMYNDQCQLWIKSGQKGL